MCEQVCHALLSQTSRSRLAVEFATKHLACIHTLLQLSALRKRIVYRFGVKPCHG